AQAWFGIEADLATYGKVVGGGMPIGVIAGKAIYMDVIDGGMWNYGDDSYPQAKRTFFAGTYCKHPLAMAAARSVLKHLKNYGFSLQQELNRRTSDLAAELNSYFEARRLPIKIEYFGSIFGFTTSPTFSTSEDSASPNLRQLLVYYNLLYKGILLRGNGGFLSTAHTDEDIKSLIHAVQDSL
ncbi:MAG TPA: aspartate aminotransferase family protein, partial [Cyanobacteria bacterium UBA11162]|nr:aspartate aminotransferase family protein [Cyanobacteria bacterium UBA11162]